MKGSPCLYRLVKMRSSSAIPPKLVRSAGGAGAETGPAEDAAEAEAEKEEDDEVEEEVDESDDDAELLFGFGFVFFCHLKRVGWDRKRQPQCLSRRALCSRKWKGSESGGGERGKSARKTKKSTRAKEEEKRRRSWRRHLKMLPLVPLENLGLLVFFSNSDSPTR
jgi:hypothetical protein